MAAYYTFINVARWATRAVWSVSSTFSNAGVVAGYAIGGAAAGFVGGYIATGSTNMAMRGALSGALFGGIGGYYGTSWTWGRVGATSFAGGASSEIYGGDFRDGFKLSLALCVVRMGWEYAREITNRRKMQSLAYTGKKAIYNKWGELLTDGGRDVEYMPGYDDGDNNFITRGGMAKEGSGWLFKDGFTKGLGNWGRAHLYPENSLVGRMVNWISKPHDWLNSDLSKAFGFQGYSDATGMWLSGSEAYNTAFQLYSFSGMVPAAVYTTAAMVAPLPIQSIDQYME